MALIGTIVGVAIAVPAGVLLARQFADRPTGCEYQWTGTKWVLEDSYCPKGDCDPPEGRGTFIGQTVYKPCTPSPIPFPNPSTSKSCCD